MRVSLWVQPPSNRGRYQASETCPSHGQRISGGQDCGLTRKRKRVRRSSIMEGMTDGGTFTAGMGLLLFRCSLGNSNFGSNSVGCELRHVCGFHRPPLCAELGNALKRVS